MPRVRVQTGDFDVSAEIASLRAGDAGIGAVVSFVGTVRDRDGDRNGDRIGDSAAGEISGLELEHYPGMTEQAIEAMIDEALRRFRIRAARVVHRVGPLAPLAQIVLVLAASAHRGQAFAACEFLMDYLKTQAPFWKKETTAAGARWVDARAADDAALARWGLRSTNAAGSDAAAPDAAG
jgi:molybdopterin synthase catalytic subunit